MILYNQKLKGNNDMTDMTNHEQAEAAVLKSMTTLADIFKVLTEEKEIMQAEAAAVLANANDDQAAAIAKLKAWNWTPVSFDAETGTIEFMRYSESKGKEVGFVEADGSYFKA